MKELIVGGYCLEAVMRQGLARAMAERLAAARSGWTRCGSKTDENQSSRWNNCVPKAGAESDAGVDVD